MSYQIAVIITMLVTTTKIYNVTNTVRDLKDIETAEIGH